MAASPRSSANRERGKYNPGSTHDTKSGGIIVKRQAELLDGRQGSARPPSFTVTANGAVAMMAGEPDLFEPTRVNESSVGDQCGETKKSVTFSLPVKEKICDVYGNTGSNGNIIDHSGDTQLKECVRTVVDVEHGNCDETDTPVLPGDNIVHNICDDVSATESVAYFLSDD